jgi:hypothetical protein
MESRFKPLFLDSVAALVNQYVNRPPGVLPLETSKHLNYLMTVLTTAYTDAESATRVEDLKTKVRSLAVAPAASVEELQNMIRRCRVRLETLKASRMDPELIQRYEDRIEDLVDQVYVASKEKILPLWEKRNEPGAYEEAIRKQEEALKMVSVAAQYVFAMDAKSETDFLTFARNTISKLRDASKFFPGQEATLKLLDQVQSVVENANVPLVTRKAEFKKLGSQTDNAAEVYIKVKQKYEKYAKMTPKGRELEAQRLAQEAERLRTENLMNIIAAQIQFSFLGLTSDQMSLDNVEDDENNRLLRFAQASLDQVPPDQRDNRAKLLMNWFGLKSAAQPAETSTAPPPLPPRPPPMDAAALGAALEPPAPQPARPPVDPGAFAAAFARLRPPVSGGELSEEEKLFSAIRSRITAFNATTASQRETASTKLLTRWKNNFGQKDVFNSLFLLYLAQKRLESLEPESRDATIIKKFIARNQRTLHIRYTWNQLQFSKTDVVEAQTLMLVLSQPLQYDPPAEGQVLERIEDAIKTLRKQAQQSRRAAEYTTNAIFPLGPYQLDSETTRLQLDAALGQYTTQYDEEELLKGMSETQKREYYEAKDRAAAAAREAVESVTGAAPPIQPVPTLRPLRPGRLPRQTT